MGLYLLFISILTCLGIFFYTVVNSGYPIYRNMGIVIVVLAGAVSCAFVLETGHFNTFRELITTLILMVACLGAISILAYYLTSRHLIKSKKQQSGTEQQIQPRKREYRAEDPVPVAARPEQNRDMPAAKPVAVAQRIAAPPVSRPIEDTPSPEQARLSHAEEAMEDTADNRLVPIRASNVEIDKEPDVAADRKADKEPRPSVVIKREQYAVKSAAEADSESATANRQADKPAAEASGTQIRQSFGDLLEREKKRLETQAPAGQPQDFAEQIVAKPAEQQDQRRSYRSVAAQTYQSVAAIGAEAKSNETAAPVQKQASAEPFEAATPQAKTDVQRPLRVEPAKAAGQTVESDMQRPTRVEPAKAPGQTAEPDMQRPARVEPAKAAGQTVEPDAQRPTRVEPAKAAGQTVEPDAQRPTRIEPAKAAGQTVEPDAQRPAKVEPAKAAGHEVEPDAQRPARVEPAKAAGQTVEPELPKAAQTVLMNRSAVPDSIMAKPAEQREGKAEPMRKEQELPDQAAQKQPEEQAVAKREAQAAAEPEKAQDMPAAPAVSKQEAVLAKAVALVEQSRFLLAMQLLLSVSFTQESADVQKSANLLILECLIETTDFAGAQKKLFDILNARYAFDQKEKAKLKDMMSLLKTVGGGQSA